jgi:nuclear pore complex protein Nup210
MFKFVPFSVNKREVIQTANQADRSPGRIRVTPITVANGQTIRLAAVGISNTGEAFANSSSLCMRWELSSCEGLAYLDDAYGSQRSKSSWERFLVLQNESGLVLPDFHIFFMLPCLPNSLSGVH